MKKSFSCSKGFSLIEILVVIGILAIILGIGIPYFLRGKARQQLKIAANNFKADLEYARSLAKSTGREEGDAGSDIEVYFLGSGNDRTGYEVRDTTGRAMRSANFESGITVNIQNITAPLQFKGNGSISTAGTLIVKSSNVKDTWTITLVNTTGLVKINKN